MSVRVMRCFEYWVECDSCGAFECYHTGDTDNGIRIHSLRTAEKASGYKRINGLFCCPKCYVHYQVEQEKKESGYYKY